MLSDFFVGIFLSFFAIYGLVQTILNVFAYIGESRVLKDKRVYTIAFVKNDSDRIEGIANSLLLKVLKDDNGAYDNRVGIVDLGSTDNTSQILTILKRDKPHLNIYTKEEFLKEIDNIK
ncbi:MAG: hypothetical protein E7419_02750 [Ruminococcaceae bacterium]|nr:hypothetical protein [Oscillospiraceae bacterium]